MQAASTTSKPSILRAAAYLTRCGGRALDLAGLAAATLVGHKVRCAATAVALAGPAVLPAAALAGEAEAAMICDWALADEWRDPCDALSIACAAHGVDGDDCADIVVACYMTWKTDGKPDAPALCSAMSTACEETDGAMFCEDAVTSCYCTLWRAGDEVLFCE